MREKTAAINTEIKKFYIVPTTVETLLMYRTVHGTVCGLLEINYRNGRRCACASVKRQYSQPTDAPDTGGACVARPGQRPIIPGTLLVSHPFTRGRRQLSCWPSVVTSETPVMCFSTLPRVLLLFHVFI